MTFRSLAVAAVAASAALVVPVTVPVTGAHAAVFLVTVGGLLQQTPTNPPGTIRLDLPQLSGQGFLTQFLLDGTSPGTPLSPPGGVGEARSYFSALVGLQFFGTGLQFASAPGGASQLFVLNDVAGAPQVQGSRLDQVTFNAVTTFVNGMAINPFTLDVDPGLGLPDGLYVSSFAFGRSLQGTADNPPALIDSVAFPALDQVWSTGPFIFTMQFRQGNPTSPAEQASLPVAFLNGSSLFVDVVRFDLPPAIPEPATWGMMIAGFGCVGAALRRRRGGILRAKV
ncbi:MAG: PEPxxWA-CTERM sorting domain-containing protein, partial [Sphingomonadaceae bacterium]